jgi:hypothetical protein
MPINVVQLTLIPSLRRLGFVRAISMGVLIVNLKVLEALLHASLVLVTTDLHALIRLRSRGLLFLYELTVSRPFLL